MSPAPPPAAENHQLRALQAAVEHADLSLEQLWLRYFALGGDAGPVEVEAHLQGLMVLSPLQGDILAQAVNERLDELAWTSRIPYVRTVRQPAPESGPLAALVTLLDRSSRLPPERLPAVASEAARVLGVQVTIYLVDREQRHLFPLTGVGGSPADAVSVDGTTAGRAYRGGQVVPVEPGSSASSTAAVIESPRLWVPLLDGAQRLGVLEVELAQGADLYEPAIREECRWLSLALGRLLMAADRRGDALRAVRRQLRSPAAALIEALLPPLTCETDTVALAGMLALGATVGGDVFDYALSERTLAFGIFDPAGRELPAGLLAAAALSAYRSARLDGASLIEAAAAIESTVTAGFPDTFLTGILGELDLGTGRLWYLAAGHPYPRLLRRDRVIKVLTGGRRLPFGLGGRRSEPDSVGVETLQAGDWLVLHTDGLVNARDPGGASFGEDRLNLLLEREAAVAQPPPETVRRLLQTVLQHRGGDLDDDAALLLARWERPQPALNSRRG